MCEEPASAPPHSWPDDITQWPVGGAADSIDVVVVFYSELVTLRALLSGLHTPENVEAHRLQTHGLHH